MHDEISLTFHTGVQQLLRKHRQWVRVVVCSVYRIACMESHHTGGWPPSQFIKTDCHNRLTYHVCIEVWLH